MLNIQVGFAGKNTHELCIWDHQKPFTEMKYLRDPKCPHKLVPDLPACRRTLRKTLGLTEGQAWREGHVFQNSKSNLVITERRKASTHGYS